MRLYDEARWLLQQYLVELAVESNHKGGLHVNCLVSSGRDFLAKEAWICINLRDASASELGKVRAFLEIVSQLSQSADFQWREFYHAFWKHALMKPLACTICSEKIRAEDPEPTELDDFAQLMESEGPRFLLNFGKVMQGRLQLEMLHDLLFMDPKQALGEKHSRILSRLTAQNLPASGGGAEAVRASNKTFRTELGLMLPMHCLSTSEFRALAQLLDDIAEHEESDTSLKANGGVRYEITTLSFPPGDKTLEHMDIRILEDMIASDSSTIRHLRIESALGMLSCVQSLQIFEQLLRSSVCRSLGETEPTLESLQLYNLPFEHPHVASICSALRYSSSLTKLHLDWSIPGIRDDNISKQIWAWIAYGIFHPDSEAKLDRLTLSGPPLKSEDTAAFASIIRSPRPGRELWMLEHGDLPGGTGLEEVALPPSQRVFVQLKAKTKLRVAPKVKAQALGFLAARSEEFEVAVDLTAWICVVVRGCGLGWVQNAAIVSRREMLSKCQPVPQAPSEEDISVVPSAAANVKVFDRYSLVEELSDEEEYWSDEEEEPIDHWVDGPDPIEQIKFLLQMIGHNLEGLNYASVYELQISESDFGQILGSCPNLTHLNLMGTTIDSLAPLADRYQAQQCRISTLNIYSDEGDAHLLSQLAELLESPFSTPLRSVTVNGDVESTDCLEKLKRVLKTNRSLQTLFFNSTNPTHDGIFVAMQRDFEATLPHSRLSLSSKCAFLSAIESHSKRERVTSQNSGPSSLGKLDSSIVSQVFAFSGIPLSRTMVW